MKRNGTWTGIIGIVMRKEVDIGMASLTISTSRLKVVDFLLPLLSGMGEIYIREPDESKMYWNIFLVPFKQELWGAIMVTLLLLSCGLWFIYFIGHRHGVPESEPYGLLNSFHCIFSSLLAQGQNSTPRSWSCRTVYLASYLLGVVILGAYSGALTSFLTVHRPKIPFNSFQEMLSDGSYQFQMAPSSDLFEYFRDSSNTTFKEIYGKYLASSENAMPYPKEGIRRICSRRNYAYMVSSVVTQATDSDINYGCKIMRVPVDSYRELYSIVITKDSPYTSLINYNLREMRSSGLLLRLRKLCWPRNEDQKISVDISLEEMLPVFAILILGVLIAIILLAVEHGMSVMLCQRYLQYTQSDF
ncbi:probable glutamate receptor [Periplaneta americana]|uniref:probable glutamate receptor n=1 Tax=Periplaneta americana TaxID=6978 RepID=UPI0037E732D5